MVLAGCATAPLHRGADLPQVGQPDTSQGGTSGVPPVVTTVPVPTPIEPPHPAPRHIAILVSDDIPAYAATAAELQDRIGATGYTTYNLHGDSTEAELLVAQLEQSGADQLVAIGLLAARSGRRYSKLPMVFCQVPNYSNNDLITSNSSGVNLLPPFSMQLGVWKEISPTLRRVGVITGPNQDELIATASRSAQAQRVELVSRVVNSDQEALYVFKRLIPQIDGLWLLPDNRVLSPRVIREIMAYAAKHRKQVLVFSPGLLDLGGLMSISSQESDVVNQVMMLLNESGDTQSTRPAMTPLTELHLEINPHIAQKLGLIIPRTLARYLR